MATLFTVSSVYLNFLQQPQDFWKYFGQWYWIAPLEADWQTSLPLKKRRTNTFVLQVAWRRLSSRLSCTEEDWVKKILYFESTQLPYHINIVLYTGLDSSYVVHVHHCSLGQSNPSELQTTKINMNNIQVIYLCQSHMCLKCRIQFCGLRIRRIVVT